MGREEQRDEGEGRRGTVGWEEKEEESDWPRDHCVLRTFEHLQGLIDLLKWVTDHFEAGLDGCSMSVTQLVSKCHSTLRGWRGSRHQLPGRDMLQCLDSTHLVVFLNRDGYRIALHILCPLLFRFLYCCDKPKSYYSNLGNVLVNQLEALREYLAFVSPESLLSTYGVDGFGITEMLGTPPPALLYLLTACLNFLSASIWAPNWILLKA